MVPRSRAWHDYPGHGPPPLAAWSTAAWYEHTALAARAEECQLPRELDMHSQINQSLWGSRSQELEGRVRWWEQIQCFFSPGISLESKKQRDTVVEEHVSGGINSGQADSWEKEYSRNELLHSNHLWRKWGSCFLVPIQRFSRCGWKHGFLEPDYPGSHRGSITYWLCELEHVSPSLWISVSAAVSEGHDDTCFKVLLRGFNKLICANYLE